MLPPGARTQALALYIPGVVGGKVLVGWWVLVGGAVVGLEVGSGGVAATAAAAGPLLLMVHFSSRGRQSADLNGNW